MLFMCVTLCCGSTFQCNEKRPVLRNGASGDRSMAYWCRLGSPVPPRAGVGETAGADPVDHGRDMTQPCRNRAGRRNGDRMTLGCVLGSTSSWLVSVHESGNHSTERGQSQREMVK